MNKNCLKSIALAGILILPGMSHAMGYDSFGNNQNTGGGYGSTQYNNFGNNQNMGTLYAGNPGQEQSLKNEKKALKRNTQNLEVRIYVLEELIQVANECGGMLNTPYLNWRMQALRDELNATNYDLAIVKEQNSKIKEQKLIDKQNSAMLRGDSVTFNKMNQKLQQVQGRRNSI